MGTLSLLRDLTPPLVWRAARRIAVRRPPVLVHIPEDYRSANYQGVRTIHNAKPLHEGRFAEIYERHYRLDHHVPYNVTRYRQYNLCMLGRLCRVLPGDFLFCGVAWGVAPHVVYDFLDFADARKRMHLVDPFTAIGNTTAREKQFYYNDNAENVRRQYPADAPVAIHKQTIPDAFPLSGVDAIAFAHLNTGDPAAEVESLPYLFSKLSRGGIIVIDNYATFNGQFAVYDPAFAALGITPFWLPSGQAIIFK